MTSAKKRKSSRRTGTAATAPNVPLRPGLYWSLDAAGAKSPCVAKRGSSLILAAVPLTEERRFAMAACVAAFDADHSDGARDASDTAIRNLIAAWDAWGNRANPRVGDAQWSTVRSAVEELRKLAEGT